MTLEELNAASRTDFVEALGWIFEASPWVAERAWDQRPFRTVDDVHAAMIAGVAHATSEEQLVLLRAHPDLGAQAQMSDASTREQTDAGLAALSRGPFERLRALNAAYREKFGFPFLYAVKGSTAQDILNALERRLTATREAEHEEALRQVYRIARFRLEEVIA